MKIEIPINNNFELCYKYISFLNPILKLKTETEKKILASYFCLYIRHSDYSDDTLYSLMFSEQIKKSIKAKHIISEKNYTNAIENLQKNKIILDNKLNPRITQNIKNKDFKIEIQFTERR